LRAPQPPVGRTKYTKSRALSVTKWLMTSKGWLQGRGGRGRHWDGRRACGRAGGGGPLHPRRGHQAAQAPWVYSAHGRGEAHRNWRAGGPCSHLPSVV
jgi:hypothetical protein